MTNDQSFTTQIDIMAPQATVHTLLTTVDGLKQWWENPVSGTPEAAGTLRFGFDDSDSYSIMHVDTVTPSRVEWKVVEDTDFNGEWEGTKICFDLESVDDNSTRLRLTHIGLTPDLTSYEGCAEGWKEYVNTIKMVSES